MGTVFLAEDLRLPREVAIKIVRLDLNADPGIRLRFVREANTLARLSHPGVTALFDAGELDDGSLFLVMERLRGRDLGSLLASEGRGTPAQVGEVARQAGAALAAAHRAGVVHRDVKPENLVLTRDGDRLRVKVVDFGLAQAPEAGRALTRTGMVVGTPAFMAPEQVMDEELSASTDIYALGGRRLGGAHRSPAREVRSGRRDLQRDPDRRAVPAFPLPSRAPARGRPARPLGPREGPGRAAVGRGGVGEPSRLPPSRRCRRTSPAGGRRRRGLAPEPTGRTCETGVPCPDCLGLSRPFVTATSGSSGRDRSSRAWERGCSGSRRDGSS